MGDPARNSHGSGRVRRIPCEGPSPNTGFEPSIRSPSVSNPRAKRSSIHRSRHTLTALIHSTLSPRESARHSRRICGSTQRLPCRRLVTLFESLESDGEAATRENHPRKKGNRLKTVPLLVSRIDVYEQWVTCGEVGWDDTAAEVQIAEAGDGWVERHIGHGHICLYTEPVSADVRTRPLTCNRN